MLPCSTALVVTPWLFFYTASWPVCRLALSPYPPHGGPVPTPLLLIYVVLFFDFLLVISFFYSAPFLFSIPPPSPLFPFSLSSYLYSILTHSPLRPPTTPISSPKSPATSTTALTLCTVEPPLQSMNISSLKLVILFLLSPLSPFKTLVSFLPKPAQIVIPDRHPSSF